MLLIYLFSLSIILIILIFFMVNCKYLLKELRNITEEPSGYFKMGQVMILLFVLFCFIYILIYKSFIDVEKVSPIDVIFTVIVGILGTLIGLFFGAKAEQYISESRKEFMRGISITNIKKKELLEKFKERMVELEKKINK